MNLDNYVEKCFKYLFKSKELLFYLHEKRGLQNDILKKYKIGYDQEIKRYTIPIPNICGSYNNVKKYSPVNKVKMLNSKGSNASLFPIEVLNNIFKKSKGTIYLCEGEWDALLLNQFGFAAITTTTGTGTWKKEWDNYFDNIDVVIIYDCDDPGRKGALKIGKHLLDKCRSVKIIDLCLKDKEDITDWFNKYQKTKNELNELINKTDPLDNYQMVELSESMSPKYYDKDIKFNGIIVGKDPDPYLIPKKVKVSCTGGEGNKKCRNCEMAKFEYDPIIKELKYEEFKDVLVPMVGASDSQTLGLIRKGLGLPSGKDCRKLKIEILERQSIEDISIIPDIDSEKSDQQKYVIRKAFVFGENIDTNQTYLFRGTTWNNPMTQSGLHLITNYKSSMDNISKYVIDEKIKEDLKVFQPEDIYDKASIWEKLKDIYSDFTYNVTFIYNRFPIIMATDMVYHSIINFKFLKRPIEKGWLECTIVGDTGTGKTKTIHSLLRHFKAGEFLTSGENTSRSGIIGGAQQHGNRWTLTWGKVPLNDKRLLVIDEADQLKDKGIIDEMSGLRSTGVAEIVMIHTQRTMARTRLIFITNPLNGRVSEYNYGINIIKDIFGKQQDIRRIDFALAASKEEVDSSIINKIHNEKYPHKYTTDICHARTMWAWNRSSDQIKFVKNSEQKILDYANKFGNAYTPDIPLCLDAEMRMKLARMSVACAAMTYSTNESGDDVIVTPAHVDVVTDFLEKIYNNPIMGFNSYSSQRNKLQKINKNDKQMLDSIFENEDIVQEFLETNAIKPQELEFIFATDRDRTKEYLKILRSHRALISCHHYYKKTSTFIKYLKARKRELQNPKVVKDGLF